MAFSAGYRWLVGTTLVLLAGCDDGLGTIPISGKVMYQGRPLAQGTVLYAPVDTNGRQARAELKPDGTFQLTTPSLGDGALPGEYHVVILALAPHPGEPGRGNTPADAPPPTIERKFIIPLKYTIAEETPFQDTVDGSHPGYKEWKID